MKPGLVVPVHLGCCPHGPRCLLCPPPPEPPTPELVRALVDAYRADADDDGPVEVRFFGGAPPDDALLEAARGHAIRVRVRPDLLDRAGAARLWEGGVRSVELDALTFVDEVLRDAGRRYGGERVELMSRALADQGFEVGGVLAPGLPRSSHARAVDDARRAAGLWRFARLHPVLVLEGSGLRALHEDRRYDALELGEAVTVARDMLDVLEDAGVQVVRVGLQAGPDGFGRAVAGPRHPALRELVEARRALDRLRAELAGLPRGAHARVACAPSDASRTRGPLHVNLRTLRAELGLASLSVVDDASLPRGAVRVMFDTESP